MNESWTELGDAELLYNLSEAFSCGDSTLCNTINAEWRRRYGYGMTLEEIKNAGRRARMLDKTPDEHRIYRDSTRMPFGKYEGEKMCHVPDGYLLWLADQAWFKKSWPKLYAYVMKHKKMLEAAEDKRFWEEMQREEG